MKKRLGLSPRLMAAIATLLVASMLFMFVGPALASTTAKKKNPSTTVGQRPQAQPRVRTLLPQEMKSLRGRQNAYMCGNQKFWKFYKGVNLCNGNYMCTTTDIAFAGGRGGGLSVTRTYNSNSTEEGPFGYGWSWSFDLKQAGGIVKTKTGADHATPANVVEEFIPGTQQPLNASRATDIGGNPRDLERDADGGYTSTLTDNNEYQSAYFSQIEGQGDNAQLVSYPIRDTVTTLEKTVFVYQALDFSSSDPANTSKERQLTSITDRFGNQTLYTYTPVTVNGVAKSRLYQVTDPEQRTLQFTWTVYGTGQNQFARVTQVAELDPANPQGQPLRVVSYAYNTDTGDLLTVTCPQGRATTYAYHIAPGSWNATWNLLSDISDNDDGARKVHIDYGPAQDYGYFTIYPVAGVTDRPDETQNPGTNELYNYATSFTYGPYTVYYYLNGYPVQYSYLGCSVQRPSQNEDGIDTIVVSDPATPLLPIATALAGPNLSYGTPPGWDIVDECDIGSAWVWDPTDFTLQKEITGADRYEIDGFQPYPVRPNVGGGEVPGVQKTYAYNGLGMVTDETVIRDFPGTEGDNPPLPVTTHYDYYGYVKLYQKQDEIVTRNPGNTVLETDFDYYPMPSQAWTPGTNGEPGQLCAVWTPVCPKPNDPQITYDYEGWGRVATVETSQVAGPYIQTTYVYDDVDQIPGYGHNAFGNPTQVIEDSYGGFHRTTKSAYDPHGWTVATLDAANRLTQTQFFDDGQAYTVNVSLNSVTKYHVTNSYSAAGRLTGIDETDQWGVEYVQSLGYQYGRLTSYSYSNMSVPTDDYAWTYHYNHFGDRTEGDFGPGPYGSPTDLFRYKYEGYGTSCDGNFPNPGRWFSTLKAFKTTGGTECKFAQADYLTSHTGVLMNAKWNYQVYLSDPCGGDPAPDLSQGYFQTYYYFAGMSVHYKAGQIYGNGATQLRHVETYRHWVDENNGQHDDPVALTRYYAPAQGGGFPEQQFYFDNFGDITNKHQELDYPTQVQWTENYAYDPGNRLQSVAYNDGVNPGSATYGYDFVGNRTSDSSQPGTWAYDNLNRMTNSPGRSYLNDVVGNRTRTTQAGVQTNYTWDVLNRMISYKKGTYPQANLGYRSDGMRSWLQGPWMGGIQPGGGRQIGNNLIGVEALPSGRTVWKYDGQMQVQETHQSTQTGAITGTQFVPGMRGVECQMNSNGAVDWFIYDGHGNVICTVDGNETGQTWGTVRHARSFDVWGNIRALFQDSNSLAGPKHSYCGRLGHNVVPELGGLIYMRARYYEPWTGRFVSEDPSCTGGNWYAYCRDNPLQFLDFSGRDPETEADIEYLMVLLEDVLVGRESGFGKEYRVGRIVTLITAMGVNLDTEATEAAGYYATAAAYGASGNMDMFDVYRGMGGECNAWVIVGICYMEQMALGIEMIEMGLI